MTPQKIIIKKIEFRNIYYNNNSQLLSKKTTNKTYNHPFLITKIHTIPLPAVFISVIEHKDLNLDQIFVFICYIFIINCVLMTINKTTPQHSRRVRRLRFMLPPTTDE